MKLLQSQGLRANESSGVSRLEITLHIHRDEGLIVQRDLARSGDRHSCKSKKNDILLSITDVKNSRVYANCPIDKFCDSN